MSKKEKKQAAFNPALCDLILSPVITEKSQSGVEQNKMTFKVRQDACKTSVKKAIEALFDVKVEKVNIVNLKGKVKIFRGQPGRRSDTKKAIVTLAQGQSIDVTAAV